MQSRRQSIASKNRATLTSRTATLLPSRDHPLPSHPRRPLRQPLSVNSFKIAIGQSGEGPAARPTLARAEPQSARWSAPRTIAGSPGRSLKVASQAPHQTSLHIQNCALTCGACPVDSACGRGCGASGNAAFDPALGLIESLRAWAKGRRIGEPRASAMGSIRGWKQTFVRCGAVRQIVRELRVSSQATSASDQETLRSSAERTIACLGAPPE